MNSTGREKLPLVSVIIPAFNNGRFLVTAIESVLGQTYPEEKREIIVVDDGSTDNTPEVLRRYRGNFSCIRQENRGIASARNMGISRAVGDIITFLDSDDLWYEERLQRVVAAFMERPDTGMVYHPIELVDRKGITIVKNFYTAFGYEEGLSGWIGNEIASGRIFSGGSSFAFRRDIADICSPVPVGIRRGIDYYMTVISSCLAPAAYIPEILGKYRLHRNNVTLLTGWNNLDTMHKMNSDFAYMRQKVIDKIMDSSNLHRPIDLNILRRDQTKERIFSLVLSGERSEAIKQIPGLFQGRPPLKGLLRGAAVSLMALIIPAFLYPKMVRTYGLLKRLNPFR